MATLAGPAVETLPAPPSDELARALKARAVEVGFDLCGIAPAVSPTTFDQLREWLRRGYDGEMSYIVRRADAYESPDGVLAGVRSVVMVALNYHAGEDDTGTPRTGRIARYARPSIDYHALLRVRLRRLAALLHEQRPGCRTRCVVDTAPLLERDFARLAGLGWFGKNTMLIHKRLGSWLYLGALLTDVELPADAPHDTAHCGTCTRCLDACPTSAFPEPYVLDATRCISYLTIELRDLPIPEILRAGVGDWLFGCDVCNDVCPWNHKAPATTVPALQPDPAIADTDAVELLSLSREEFDRRFARTPLSRPGRDGMLRNACLVLGNSGDARFREVLAAAAADESPLVRDAAAWALEQLRSPHCGDLQETSISTLSTPGD
jgi:epoxyqueuosine reductase